MPVLNHVAYLSPDLAPTVRGLRLRVKEFLHAKFGEVEVRLYDATHVIGCAIEIHRKSAFIEEFFVW